MELTVKSKEREFKEVKEKLYAYYRDKIKETAIEKELELLNKQLEETDAKIKSSNIHLEADIQAMQLNERVQTSNVSSCIDKAVERSISLLENKQAERIEEIYKKEEELKDLRYQNKRLDYLLSIFNEEIQNFLYLRYGKKLTYMAIQMELNKDYSVLAKQDIKILEDILKFKMI